MRLILGPVKVKRHQISCGRKEYHRKRGVCRSFWWWHWPHCYKASKFGRLLMIRIVPLLKVALHTYILDILGTSILLSSSPSPLEVPSDFFSPFILYHVTWAGLLELAATLSCWVAYLHVPPALSKPGKWQRHTSYQRTFWSRWMWCSVSLLF